MIQVFLRSQDAVVEQFPADTQDALDEPLFPARTYIVQGVRPPVKSIFHGVRDKTSRFPHDQFVFPGQPANRLENQVGIRFDVFLDLIQVGLAMLMQKLPDLAAVSPIESIIDPPLATEVVICIISNLAGNGNDFSHFQRGFSSTTYMVALPSAASEPSSSSTVA